MMATHFSFVITAILLNWLVFLSTRNRQLVTAQSLDVSAQFGQPPAKNRGGIVERTIENRTNVGDLEAGCAVGAHLAEAFEILFRIDTIIARGAARRPQQADRFVVQHRAAAQTAGTGKLRDRHRHPSFLPVSTLKL
jgi:hypothetical protein